MAGETESGDRKGSVGSGSLIITRDDHLVQRCHEYLGAVDVFTYPFFGEIDRKPGKLEQIGSGVAVQKGAQRYLVTAAHVLQHFKNGRDLYVADGNTEQSGSVYRLPASMFKLWRVHDNVNLDLAVAPINGTLSGLNFLPVEKITRGYLGGRGHYFLAGYPNSQNKEWDVNPRSGPKRTGIASIIVKVDQTLDFKKDEKNSRDFLGFKYERIFDEGVLKQKGTALRGMSGCGLWFFPNEDIGNPLLAGVLIEFWDKSKNAYATLANFVNDLL